MSTKIKTGGELSHVPQAPTLLGLSNPSPAPPLTGSPRGLEPRKKHPHTHTHTYTKPPTDRLPSCGGLHWSGALELSPCLLVDSSPSSRLALAGAHLPASLPSSMPSLVLVLYNSIWGPYLMWLIFCTSCPLVLSTLLCE